MKVKIKRHYFLDHTSFWEKFKKAFINKQFLLIFLFLSFSLPAFATKSFSFKIGEEINIFADKVFRDTKKNILKATGNVVFNRKKENLYGEIASFDFKKGVLKVEGNARFIGPEYRLFGHSLQYNVKTGSLEIVNGKILNEDYIVIGDRITRNDENTITARNAEYTTCQDCPESWSIFGRKITIHLNDYLTAKDVLIKIKGVTMVYVPYLFLPIKEGRQTGLLFPHLSVSSNDGASYEQPFFWTMGNSADGTISPFIFSKRGRGAKVELRKTFGMRKWMKFDGLQINDQIYRPGINNLEVKPGDYSRYFIDYSQGFQFKDMINHTMFYNQVRDLDFLTDFDSYTSSFLPGSEFGGDGNIDVRLPRFNFSIEGYYKKNQIIADPLAFDNDYVQILPRVNFELVPQTLLKTKVPGLQNISIGFEGEAVKFRQRKINEDLFIRNAERVSLKPVLRWNFFKYKGISLKNKIENGFQFYRFSHLPDKPSFRKKNTVLETSLSFEFEKTFGLAYKEKISLDNVEKIQNDNKNLSPNIIGSLPVIEKNVKNNFVIKQKNAYKHLSEFRINHYFGAADKGKGFNRFANQLKQANGLFDYLDAFATQRHLVSNLTTNITEIPRNNTLELEFNNSFIRKVANGFSSSGKSGFITNHFNYSRMAYFDISQGIEIRDNEDELKDSLTRLKVSTGYNLNSFNINLLDYYFYDRGDHVLSFSLTKNWDWLRLKASFDYDPRSTTQRSFTSSELELLFNDKFKFITRFDYDFNDKVFTRNNNILEYSPLNNCWKIDLSYSQNEIDKNISLNFYLNFGKNKFSKLTGVSNEI